ncbi:MAG: amidohydrolase family protein [Alphaproteobacteria bacterium]|nr:amidohydrolase family protein [Alphaproteobacteria bacterium]
MATNDEWLAQVREDIIEPDLPICDTHHHLWDHREGRVERRYLMEEIQKDLRSGHNIVTSVFVECRAMYRDGGPEEMKPVGEVEFVNGIAAMAASGLYGGTKIAAGIVGHANLQLGSRVKGVLEALIAAAPARFRGIRRNGAWDADPLVDRARGVTGPGLYLDAKFREGFAEIAPLGLIFEGVCRHPQLPDFVDLARAFPGTTMVLNHLGGVAGVGSYAGRRDEIFAEWKRSIAALAACPNIVMKLGGINMEYAGFGWHEKPQPPTSRELCDATRRYYETAIENFGADRCMFESNFPVDKVSCSYPVLWNAFKRITERYSAGEKAKLYHDTAARVYRLG